MTKQLDFFQPLPPPPLEFGGGDASELMSAAVKGLNEDILISKILF